MTETDLQTAGITDGLIRLSLGYTGTIEQRLDQFTAAVNEMRDIGTKK